jgi:hypothetical protein
MFFAAGVLAVLAGYSMPLAIMSSDLLASRCADMGGLFATTLFILPAPRGLLQPGGPL